MVLIYFLPVHVKFYSSVINKYRILTFLLFWRWRQLFLSHWAVKAWIPTYRSSTGQRLVVVIVILAGQMWHWRLRFGLDHLRFMSPLHSEQGCHRHQLSVTRSRLSWNNPHLTSTAGIPIQTESKSWKLPKHTIPPQSQRSYAPFLANQLSHSSFASFFFLCLRARRAVTDKSEVCLSLSESSRVSLTCPLALGVKVLPPPSHSFSPALPPSLSLPPSFFACLTLFSSKCITSGPTCESNR